MPGGDLLSLLRQDLAELLAAQDVPHSAAAAITEKLIERVQLRCGGDRVFVPKVDRSKRDAEILAGWKKGDGVDDIAKRHGIDRATVYRIIGRRNQRKTTEGGGGGFGSPGWNL